MRRHIVPGAVAAALLLGIGSPNDAWAAPPAAAKPAAAKPAAAKPAAAKPAAAKPGAYKGPVKPEIKDAIASLQTGDNAKVEGALVVVRTAGRDGGGRAATVAIVERLEKGLPKDTIKKALETLTDLEDANGADAGVMYLEHRDAEVRLAAVKCLGASKSDKATAGLRHALADVDARVHSTAASLLGQTKSAEAVPDLTIALDKKVTSAAVSIGMLCDAKSCDILLDRLKSMPFDVISSGLEPIFERKEIGDDYKKKVITVVRELASQRAREFLQKVRQAWPAGGSKPVAEALDKAVKDLEGASK